MARKPFGEEPCGELAARTTMWLPAIAGAILLGPVGVLLGLAVSVSIIASSGSDIAPPAGGGQRPKG